MPDIRKRAASALVAVALLLCAALLSGCGVIIIRDGSDAAPTGSAGHPDTATSADSETPAPSAEETTTYKVITTADAKEKAQAALDEIILRDFGGISVFIASTSPDTFAPSSVDSDVSEARYVRQKLVEDKLNTTILTIGGTSDQIFDDLRTAEKAGTYYADIIAVPIWQLGKFIAAGLLLRVNSLPFLDLDAEWFDADCMTQATAGYSSAYTVIGDVNLEPGKLFSVLWNKALAASVSAGDLYKLTYRGVWTWDYMLTCARAIADVDGGIYGIASSAGAETFISALYASSGEKLFETAADGALAAAFGTERAQNVVEKLKMFFTADAGLLGDSLQIPTSQGTSAFYAGNAGFIVTPLETVEWFTNMKANWGVLPLPKYDEPQEKYYAYVDRGALSFSTPSGNKNIEAAGVFMSAFSAATGNLIADAFYTHLIKYVIRDSDSLNMMDIIRDGATIGFADIFASGYPAVETGALGSLYGAVRGSATLGYYHRNYAYQLDALLRKFT
ncbi:MAG: extracellular solute-binding protein [Eubacteriales bacterium]|jgi:maltose-binding protein MalE|nr:extracellular solute-binding protein [Clostridiales bacterium]